MNQNSSQHLVSPEENERQRRFAGMVRELPHRPQSYHVVTYGCQMNAHDSEKIAGMLESMGMAHSESREEADFVIFNTCCVRENAERRALGNVTWLKEVRKTKPDLMIAVCGCMIQEPGMAEKILKQYRFVDLAFGTANLHKLPEMMFQALNGGVRVVSVENEDVVAEQMPIRRLRHDAAYITIMYGCDNFCSYCIVPFVRGRERSREPRMILREAEDLLASGVSEIMLLGQNVNSYGKGLQGSPTFAGLLKQMDTIGIPRIRFMTSHPKDLSDDLIETMAGSRHILPQFHLPVQSGSNEILRRMNRHYSREQYLERVARLREAIPGIGLSTDIIVGFPGETEDQFRELLDFVEETEFDRLGAFTYSPEEGTPAAKLPDQLPEEIRQERYARLMELQQRISRRRNEARIGDTEAVLVTAAGTDGFCLGRSSREAPETDGEILVRCGESVPEPGQFIPVRITEAGDYDLKGEML